MKNFFLFQGLSVLISEQKGDEKMSKKGIFLSVLGFVAASFLLSSGGYSAADNPAISYMLIFQYADLPENVGQQIAVANGEMTAGIKQIGVAVASSSDPKFIDKASRISGIRSVVPDPVVQWSGPEPIVEEMSNGFDAPLFFSQWALPVIHAPEAWDLGARGEGVTVFVLDNGIDPDHPDISPNLDTSLCKSFVPISKDSDVMEDWHVSPQIIFNHGTYVAGIIAAAQTNSDPWNDPGIIGVAPLAKLVAVKVLSENTGKGLLSYLNQGIVYAANNGADVINMSLAGYLPSRSGFLDNESGIYYSAKMVGEILHATQRAITYAYQKGATIVAAAGNSAIDADHDKNAVIIPAQLAQVIAVSATDETPLGFPEEPWLGTNYGQTLVSFAAPGDAIVSDNNSHWICRNGKPCMRFAGDSGTSPAAAHVSGVAALIIGQNGGSLHPAQVNAILIQSADDIGKPGKDDYFGMGRVNAYKAVFFSR